MTKNDKKSKNSESEHIKGIFYKHLDMLFEKLDQEIQENQIKKKTEKEVS